MNEVVVYIESKASSEATIGRNGKVSELVRRHSKKAFQARKAFRALKSLVKVQAVVRGAYVRKQARMALHCMHALAQLQVTVRARQLLSRCSDN
ncbi:protein IQ-DOMAIN 20-like [Cornus florida]|uniref:protein IQ-DOMAIN 20-like n=1 Tax=Cornus florida TaxID=4283 RepID=UPI0028A26E42|nr:protein IQ-DOMAIN 20-like [Cornus florida]